MRFEYVRARALIESESAHVEDVVKGEDLSLTAHAVSVAVKETAMEPTRETAGRQLELKGQVAAYPWGVVTSALMTMLNQAV